MRPVGRPRVVILGSGPEPHRPGHRVRLLLRPRQLRPPRRRLRDGDDQLQPGDRVAPTTTRRDRLYFEPLTAEDVANVIAAETAAAGGVPPKVIVSLGGQTPLKLARLLPAGAGRRHVADVDRPGRGPREVERAVRRAAHPAAAGRHGRRPRRRRSSDRRRGSASRCWCARATCSAGGRCRSSTTRNHLARGRWPSWPGFGIARARGRPVGRAAGADRPLPRGRHRGRRRRDPRPHRRGAASAA